MPQQVDTSIYSTIKAPTLPNPLGTIGQAANTINALNQNRLFQQTFGARQAIGQDYQKAIDPATGELNTNRLTSLVANDPNASFMTGDVAQQALARQETQINIRNEQLTNAYKHAQVMSGYVGELLANPNVTPKDVTSSITDMVARGLVTPQQAAGELQKMPTDTASLHQWLTDHYARYQGVLDTLKNALPQPQVFNAGNRQVVIDMNPVTNPNVTHELIINGLSPDVATSPTSVMVRNPDGTFTPSAVTRSQFANMSRQGPVATAVPLTKEGLPPEVASQPVATFTNNQPGTISREQFAERTTGTPGVSNVPLPLNPAAGGLAPGAAVLPSGRAVDQVVPQPQGGPQVSGNTPVGFVPTGPKLGAEEAANAAGASSGKALGNAQDEARGFPSRMFQLTKALDALKNTTTGPGTETTNYIKSFINAQNPAFLKELGLNPNVEKIKNYDEANKYLTQYAMAQAGAMGSGTDEKLATALSGNANTHISNLAAQDVVKANMALERMRQAGTLAFDQSGKGPQDFNTWMSKWSSTVDPRAFLLDQMSPKERTSFLQNLKKAPEAQRQKFADSYNLAVKLKLLPDLAAPQGAQ